MGGVVSTNYAAHRVEGYSLLTRGVSNPLQSGVFTLDQGCRSATVTNVLNPISLGTDSTLCEDDTAPTKHQKATIARFTLWSR